MKLKSLIPLYVLLLFYIPGVCGQDRFEMTVAQDGRGDFTTIQSAIDAAKAFPDMRVTIFIRNGIYREKVTVASCNTKLSLIGESAAGTVITWDDHFGKMDRGRNSTFYTWTLKVEGCVFRNCLILGNQDTLYAAGNNSRQYFQNCTIEGTTDFIFGAATALFEGCTLRSKSDSYITAASTPKGTPFGYVFLRCRLTADEGVTAVHLGRPWRDFARTVFLGCEMGSHIVPEGWSNWSGTERDKTAFYAEYQNYGPGAATHDRIPWSHQLSRREARRYTPAKILAPRIPASPEETGWMEKVNR